MTFGLGLNPDGSYLFTGQTLSGFGVYYSPSFTSADYIRLIGDGDQLDGKTILEVETFPVFTQRQQLHDRRLLHRRLPGDLRADICHGGERSGAFHGLDPGCEHTGPPSLTVAGRVEPYETGERRR